MKEAMRDKVCQLIGKYQAEEAFHREKAGPIHSSNWPGTDAVKAACCRGLSEGPRETAGGEVNSDTNGGR